MRMVMSDWEIAQDYRLGKDKQQMITVLADQNCTHVRFMRDYLINKLGFQNVPEPDPHEMKVRARRTEVNMDMFLQLYMEGYGDEELAEEMGISPTRAHSIRRRLRLHSNRFMRNCKAAEETKN